MSREKMNRAEELTGLARATLKTYAWVARSYEWSLRNDHLSFNAHRLSKSLLRNKDCRRGVLRVV